MEAGKFKGFVIDKIISENSKGNPQVVIQVEVEFSTGKQLMNYYGQLTEKTVEYTLKALVAAGIQGNSLLDPVTKGTEVSVTVVEEVDQNNKPQFRIAWVNKPFSIGAPMDEGKAKMGLKEYEGVLAKLRMGNAPVKNYAPQSAPPPPEPPPWANQGEKLPY